jgi:hypothetical protein
MSDSETLERLKAERLKAERQARLAVEREQAAIQQAAFAKRAKLWDEHKAKPVPVEEMSPLFEGEIIGIWTTQPKQPRSVESRLAGLVESVQEIIAMEGEPDWRGLLTESLEDAKQ